MDTSPELVEFHGIPHVCWVSGKETPRSRFQIPWYPWSSLKIVAMLATMAIQPHPHGGSVGGLHSELIACWFAGQTEL